VRHLNVLTERGVSPSAHDCQANPPVAAKFLKNSAAFAAQFHFFRPIVVTHQCPVEIQENPDVDRGAYPFGDVFPAIE